MEERIELRAKGGPLLGVLVVETERGFTDGGEPMRAIRKVRLEVKRGRRLHKVDLLGTVRLQDAAARESVVQPEGECCSRERRERNAPDSFRVAESPNFDHVDAYAMKGMI